MRAAWAAGGRGTRRGAIAPAVGLGPLAFADGAGGSHQLRVLIVATLAKAAAALGKNSFGFVYVTMDEEKGRHDPRPVAQVFRNTGRTEHQAFGQPPEALRNSEYYGRTKKLEVDFYSRSGAFQAVLE